jgi:hypothetical protein
VGEAGKSVPGKRSSTCKGPVEEGGSALRDGRHLETWKVAVPLREGISLWPTLGEFTLVILTALKGKVILHAVDGETEVRSMGGWCSLPSSMRGLGWGCLLSLR